MTQALNSPLLGHTGPMALNDLLPERPALIGEFSPAYEAYRQVTVADLAPMTQYEYIQALQLVDLNWAILQLKASAQVELSTGTEKTVRRLLETKIEAEGYLEADRQLHEFIEAGGDEDNFEDTVDWDAMELRIETLMSDLQSKDPAKREQATAEAISLGVDPRLVLSEQFMQNSNYNRHARTLPELEKRVRLLSAEYRELQKARPIDIVPVAQN
jgi:G3E family GTPase